VRIIPGQIISAAEAVEINARLPVTRIEMTNAGAYPIHLTAHYHVFESNPCLSFDRLAAWGMRLDVPANGAVRIEAGATVNIALVPIGGARVIHGFQAAVNGVLDNLNAEVALERLIERGFLHVSNGDVQAEKACR